MSGGEGGGGVDKGLAASKHGEFKRDWIDMKTTRGRSYEARAAPPIPTVKS